MRDYPLMFTTDRVAKAVIISPEVAENWLRFNTKNRKINPEYANQMANKISRGLWQFNGEPIIFNTDGGINDGQHRLTGCVKSGKPIETVVAWGASPDAIVTVDRGKKRSLRDNLTILRDETDNTLASVLNSCVEWFVKGEQSGRAVKRSSRVEFEDAIEYLDAHPEVKNFDHYKTPTARKIAVISVIWFAHYVCAQIDADDADYFFDHLMSGRQGENPLDETIFVLRETLMSRREDIKGEKDTQLALIFTAWNKFRDGDVPKIIRWTGKGANAQKFPVPH